MYLIADVLDEQIRDRNGENAGHVDGVVLEVREGRPPVVAYLEVSPITLLGRFSERLAAWYARYDARLGPGRGVPYRIAWRHIRKAKAGLCMDLDVCDTPINALEAWLSRTIVRRIPGG